MCGCGIVLAEIADKLGINIRVIGTPAEETFGAKYDMIKAGAFDNVDFAMQAHLDEANCVETVTLAMNSLEFDFKGVAAHAAAFPEQRSKCPGWCDRHVQQYQCAEGAYDGRRQDPRHHYPRWSGDQCCA